jgi:predicted NBD/HSP70 family sugar kinase
MPAARPDAIRSHNLGLLLREIHRDGELSRAELTVRLGLSRSTIGALVSDLTDLGVVSEVVPSGGARAGRPSHLVGPRPDGPYAIAVDVDIAHVTTAAVGLGGQVLARHIGAAEPSPAPPAAMAQHVGRAITALLDQLGGAGWPVAIGVSVPGAVNRHDGTVEFAPNLEWRHARFGAELARTLPEHLPVLVGNDADLAILAEHVRGGARDCADVIYLIGRVGVGAGIIVNGEPLRGLDGYAGEVGHNVVDPSGPPCHCGKHGCLETFVGEAALLAAAGREEAPTVENVARLFADAQAGDRAAFGAVTTVAGWLGRAIAELMNVFNPERVVLGGSLAGVLATAPVALQAAVEENRISTIGCSADLRPAELGDDGALLGAAELAFSALLADPVTARLWPAAAQAR